MVQLHHDIHLLFGGFTSCCGQPRFAPNDLWQFDVSQREWKQLIPESAPGSPPGRSQAAFASCEHGFLLYGGFDDHDSVFSTMWRYNYTANSWRALSSAGGPQNSRYAPGAAAVDGGMLMFGGLTLPVVPFNVHNDVWMFSTKTDSWRQLTQDDQPGAPGKRGQVMCATAGTFAYDGSTHATQMACYGGWDYEAHPERPFGGMWRFDLPSLTWQLLAPNATNPSPLPRLSGRLASNGTHGLLFGGEAQVGISLHAQLNSVSDLWAYPLSGGGGQWVQLAGNDLGDGPGPRQNPNFAMQGGGACGVVAGGIRQVRFPPEPQLLYSDVWQWCAE